MQLLTDDLFQENVLRNVPLALVLFETDWSGHSQIMEMILDKLEGAFGQRMAFFKTNVEMSENISHYFNVARVPTIILFRNGEPIERIFGIVAETDLSSRIQRTVSTHG
ncbi:MAG: thioredoxin family protein [bacterium]